MGGGQRRGRGRDQVAKAFGARVIATAGTEAGQGAGPGRERTVNHRTGDVVAEVRRLTGRKGADVVVEHVGQATWERSILALAHRGRLVTCGATTGAAGATELRHLFAKQLSILGSYMGSKADLLDAAALFFAGRLRSVVHAVLPLAEARRAHEMIGSFGALRKDRAAGVTEFHPPRFLRRGHVQTLVAYWSRHRLRWTLPTEDMVVEAPGGIRLLLRATWQEDPAARPTLVLVHGLGGCDRGTYSVSTGMMAWERGWNVVRMNMRGAGDSESLCARLYHAGLDTDMLAVLEAVAERTPRLAAVGFSLGANLVLLTMGRQVDRLPKGLFAGAGVSPPLDLAMCADALDRWDNFVYQRHYVRQLQQVYRRRQSLLPELYDRGRERDLRTIRDYDDVITAHYGGFRGAADYYERSSAGPYDADRPAGAPPRRRQRPHDPGGSVTRWPLPASGLVRREIVRSGGHVGFLAPTSAPGGFWAGERVMEFLEEVRR